MTGLTPVNTNDLTTSEFIYKEKHAESKLRNLLIILWNVAGGEYDYSERGYGKLRKVFKQVCLILFAWYIVSKGKN